MKGFVPVQGGVRDVTVTGNAPVTWLFVARLNIDRITTVDTEVCISERRRDAAGGYWVYKPRMYVQLFRIHTAPIFSSVRESVYTVGTSYFYRSSVPSINDVCIAVIRAMMEYQGIRYRSRFRRSRRVASFIWNTSSLPLCHDPWLASRYVQQTGLLDARPLAEGWACVGCMNKQPAPWHTSLGRSRREGLRSKWLHLGLGGAEPRGCQATAASINARMLRLRNIGFSSRKKYTYRRNEEDKFWKFLSSSKYFKFENFIIEFFFTLYFVMFSPWGS